MGKEELLAAAKTPKAPTQVFFILFFPFLGDYCLIFFFFFFFFFFLMASVTLGVDDLEGRSRLENGKFFILFFILFSPQK